MLIQTFRAAQATEVADLFHSIVHAIDSAALYGPLQKKAWAPISPNYQTGDSKLFNKHAYLAMIDGAVARFIELDPDGHLNYTYTHPVHQRKGIARALYRHLETVTLNLDLSRLFIDASLVAKPFFVRQGFKILKTSQVLRNVQPLPNCTMEKSLPGARLAANMLRRLVCWFLRDQTISIRLAVEEEHTRLLEIFNSARLATGCFKKGPLDRSQFARCIKGEVIHVAEVGGHIAGFVSVWEATAFIHHLYVCPRFQGQGLGKALLQMCERRYGLPLSLKCICANQKALGFYRRNGWVTRGCGTGPDGPWEHLWLKSTRDIMK